MGKVIHCELCKKLEFYHTTRWYMHKSEPVRENETQKVLLGFKVQTNHFIPVRKPDLVIVCKQKEGTCRTLNFAVLADHRVKIKESDMRDKNLDVDRELWKLWNMQVAVIPTVIGALGIFFHDLEKRLKELKIGGQTETIQTTDLRSTRILGRILGTRGDLLSFRL